ncbi:MAG TPA: ribosome biogenesis GTP-binding protein YihA/YsxC [Vicinamibacterales bacterium]|nr:ribosome biogenesis GTP-binding protein YihA/YsxC [Vicinamibacterales bacterium]
MPRRVTSAEFVISAAGTRDFPADGRPEIAMVGRSNVGKSTLINVLAGKSIARTSSSPGKTRLVNVYAIQPTSGTRFYLVDLPGYGHAGGGEKAREEFAALTGQYFQSRLPAEGRTAASAPVLAGIVLAIDARHPGMASDQEALRWASKQGLPFLLAATKADKLKQSEKARLPRACETAFGLRPIVVSAETGEGLDELWGLMRQWTA